MLEGDDPWNRAFALFLHSHPRVFYRQVLYPQPRESPHFLENRVKYCSPSKNTANKFNVQKNNNNKIMLIFEILASSIFK